MTGCGHFLGTLPCDNEDPAHHYDDGKNCTHAASWAADRHIEEPNDE